MSVNGSGRIVIGAALVAATAGGCWPGVVGQLDDDGNAHCVDHRRNSDETDIDCGGAECRGCFGGELCLDDTDCATGFCGDGECLYLRSCAQLQQQTAAFDGAVWVDFDGDGPTAPAHVYCDQSEDGGGWTLVFKVNPASRFDVPEQRERLTDGFNPNLLLDTALVDDRGLASHGAVTIGAALESPSSWARFTLVAAGDDSQRLAFFKRIASAESLSRWFVDDETPSSVCPQPTASMACRLGAIATDGVVTWLHGFSLGDRGFAAGGDLFLQLGGARSDMYAQFGGVCSSATDDTWRDEAPARCGNGMLVWMR